MNKLLILLALLSCGLKLSIQDNSTEIKPRLSGTGATAVASSTTYPWMVSIQYVGSHYANGMIVGRYWVLTTASTVDAVEILINAGILVTIKSDSLDVSAISGSAITRNVKAIKEKYPLYNAATQVQDIGLIMVCPSFDASRVFAPLGPTTPLTAGDVGSVVSWAPTLTALMEMSETVDADLTCSTTSASVASSLPWEADSFCTVLVSGSSACTGDSSAPFISGGRVAGIMRTLGCGADPDTFIELTPTIVSWINTKAAVIP